MQQLMTSTPTTTFHIPRYLVENIRTGACRRIMPFHSDRAAVPCQLASAPDAAPNAVTEGAVAGAPNGADAKQDEYSEYTQQGSAENTDHTFPYSRSHAADCNTDAGTNTDTDMDMDIDTGVPAVDEREHQPADDQVEVIVAALEQLVTQLGIVGEGDRALSRLALGDAYILDLLDRIVMRLFLLCEDLRRLSLFDPARHAKKYSVAFLHELCREHGIRITTGTSITNNGTNIGGSVDIVAPALLCRLLGEAQIVESVPLVRVHLHQEVVDRFLETIFVPRHRLLPAAMYTSARYVHYANGLVRFDAAGRIVTPPGRAFTADLISVLVRFGFVPLHEIRALLNCSCDSPLASSQWPLAASSASALGATCSSSASALGASFSERHERQRQLLYLIDALAVKVVRNDERLLELACVQTANVPSFLLAELRSMAGITQDDTTSDKQELCALVRDGFCVNTQLTIDQNPLLATDE